MARSLATNPSVAGAALLICVRGTASAPMSCECAYLVNVDGLKEPLATYSNESFNFGVTNFGAAVIAAIKSTANIL